ncbi:P-loop NTPase fold protein [Lentzea sp. NPDC102401]|uniref:P-loop NTPase fold protein n=1 Tax=Lentzea sp. NPDC102401 TaxID=3364128 RepID=UPI0038021414
MAAPKKIFISYSDRGSTEVVGQLRRELTTAGHEPVGAWSLKANDPWLESLGDMLGEADGAIIVVNQDALASVYIAEVELLSMLKLAADKSGFRFAVLMTLDVTLADLQDSPLARLADLQIPQAPTIEARIAEVIAAFGVAQARQEVAVEPVPFTTTRRIDVGSPIDVLTVGDINGWAALVACSDDGSVRVWRRGLSGNLELAKSFADKEHVSQVAVAEPFITIAGRAGVSVLAESVDEVLRIDSDPSTAVATGRIGDRVIVVTADVGSVLRVWDMLDGNALAAMRGHESFINALAFGSVNGLPVAISASKDGTVRVWRLDTYGLLMTLDGHEGWVTSVAFGVLFGQPIAVSCGNDFTVRVWDLTTGKQLAVHTGHTDVVWCVAVMEVDGRSVIVSGSSDKTIRLWDVRDGALGEPLRGHAGTVRGLAVMDLNGAPALVSGSDDGTIRIWEAARGDQVEWQSDSPSGADYLKRRPLATVLAQRLQRQQEKEPGASFLMHIDGPWGAGKSTLIDFIRADLEERKWVTVEFDAWREAGVGPPWWALLVALRAGICRQRGFFGRKWLRITEAGTRLRKTGAAFVLAVALLLAVSAGVFFLFWPAKLDAKSIGEVAKTVTAVLAAVGTLGGGAFVAARLLLWDSARGARLFEQSNANPMQDVARHFHWLMQKAKAPVVFFIDDLDRCPQAYVVELLDAVQTIVRSKHVTKDAAASFVVAADGAWMRASYEIEYEKFVPTIAEPGRPLGYLFLDKLFQLHVPVPMIDPPRQRTYLGRLLGLRSQEQIVQEETSVRERLRAGTSEAHVLETLRQASDEVRDRLAAEVVEKLSAPEVVAATEHQLQRFGPLLRPNPRSMKLFLNTYSVLRTVRTLEGNPVPMEALALWTVLETRWPRLADHLRSRPDDVGLFGKPKEELEDVAEDIRPLFNDPAVKALTSFKEGNALTAATIRRCCGASGE